MFKFYLKNKLLMLLFSIWYDRCSLGGKPLGFFCTKSQIEEWDQGRSLGGSRGGNCPPWPHPNPHPLNIYLPIFSLCMFLFALSLCSAILHVILCYGTVTFGSTCNVIFLANDYQEAHYIPLKISFLVIIALTWNFILKIFQTYLI